MKNFEKILIIGISLIILIVIIVFNYKDKENDVEILQENTYLNLENETEDNNIILHITGEVNNPGIVEVEEGSRLIDVIEKAGGLTPNADESQINLAYIVADGQKIYIPNINEEKNEEYINGSIGGNIIIEDINSIQKNKVNINTATQTELETLNGIGPSIALKIINYRKENGKFKNIEEIKNVPGIGESKYEAIKDNICV